MSTSADSNPPNWLELPRDVTSTILLKLGAIEILTSAQNVCSTWRNICKDPSMWRCIDTWNLDEGGDIEYDLEKICRHAVDRSSGDLVDINVESFGTDDLLKYITDRSSRLMRLRLVSCHGISNEGLSEAVAKLPLLEELDLSYCLFSKEALEAVGRCSPLLKSFKLISWGYRHPQECNEEALAIAENMPGLRHLQICGNKLTDDGLLAILDGCPHLESLDLRQCFNVNLRGNLARACAERIKDLRSPTDYYEFDPEIADDGSFDEDDSLSSFSFDHPSGFSGIEFLSDDDDDSSLGGHGGSYSDYDLYYDYGL